MSEPDRTTTLTLDDAAVALRTFPYGGIDDSTRSLRFPPAVQATVSPVIVAIRWAAIMYGMVYAAFQVATQRNLAVVDALVVVLFLTSWRTMRPIRLNGERRRDVVLAFTDAILVGAAVGLSGGFDSPYIFAVVACAAVVAFGWGIRAGCLNLVVGILTMVAVQPVASHGLYSAPDQAVTMGLLLLLTVALAGLLRNRLLDAERRRVNLSGRLDLLRETNVLLDVLNQVARTLPMSLDLREAMNNARQQIQKAFDANAVALVTIDDLSDDWTPQITEGCALRPSSTFDELPLALRWGIESTTGPVLVSDLNRVAARLGSRAEAEVEGDDLDADDIDADDLDTHDALDSHELDADDAHELERDGDGLRDGSIHHLEPGLAARHVPAVGVGTRSRCGLYTAVRARGRIVGALAIEHRSAGRYTERDRMMIEGLGDVLALTVDNARSFRRLRTLGAEEERSRIARDLHDRLGQWLSYISFELERIITSSPEGSDELDHLYDDVQTAIDELRETLRQLRSGVTEDRSLAVVAEELIGRFNHRGETLATLTVTNPGERLPVRVENELLRVLQEGLSNVAKHAAADQVDITWTVDDGLGTLVIADNGRGFDPARGVRESAYGLVGMRERADVVGARIAIESAPGLGTTVTITAGRTEDQRAEERTASEASWLDLTALDGAPRPSPTAVAATTDRASSSPAAGRARGTEKTDGVTTG